MFAFILEFNNTLLLFLFFTLACNNGHWEHSGNNCRKCWGHWGRVRGWWPKSKGRHKSKSGLFQPIEITGNVICIIAFSVSIYIFANRLNDAMNADVYHLLCKWTMHVTFFCVNSKYLYVNYHVIMHVPIVLGTCRAYMNNSMNWIYVCDAAYCINV